MINQKQQHYLIAILFLIIAIDTMGIGFVWPLFGPLFTGSDTTLFSGAVSIKWRNILYGITIGIASLSAFISSPILGDLSDRLGRRKILLTCLLGTSIGMGISILGIIYQQVVLLIFSRAWLGAVAGSQVIAHATIIDISEPGNKSVRIGIISAANNIGYIFGPIISTILIDPTIVSWFKLTTPFYFAAILAFLCALLLLFTLKADNLKLTKVVPNKLKYLPKPLSLLRIFNNLQVRPMAWSYFYLQIGWALYLQTNFVTLIQKFNYSSQRLGHFLAWLGVIFCFNLLLIVRVLTKYLKINTIIYLTLLTAAICCLLASYINTAIAVWLNLLPMATAIALGSNAILTTLSNLAHQNEQGWIMGIGNSISSLAWAITPPIAGFLLNFGMDLPLTIASLTFLLSFLSLIRTRI